MKKTIDNCKSQLDGVFNVEELSEEERINTASAIEARIKELETLVHMTTRDNLAAKHALQGETLSKYWINLNKTKPPRDTLYRLKKTTLPGKPPEYKTRSDQMADIAKNYHETLQKQNINDHIPKEQFNEVLDHLQPQVDETAKQRMQALITAPEIADAMKGLPHGKAAGIDGIPYEFWVYLQQKFDTKNPRSFNILRLLTLVFNDIEKHGIAAQTDFAKGWLCPLYKKGDITEIGNYRPITVLNTDYRIFTWVLTFRLSKVAPQLVHQDQAGFMKNRRIEDLTELVKLMIANCELNEENGVIVCLDQEKAYDKIRHEFLWATLEKFGLPEHFIKTVQALYQDAETVVILNGVLSLPYKVVRGVRQGDPLSCLLFNLAIESLASMLQASQLRGFTIPGKADKLIAKLFADDTTVYLSQEDNYNDLTKILKIWCRASVRVMLT